MREWLKELREQAGMTQENVADRVNVARTYYTRIENGQYNLPVKTAKKIAEALNFDWTRFFEEDHRTA